MPDSNTRKLVCTDITNHESSHLGIGQSVGLNSWLMGERRLFAGECGSLRRSESNQEGKIMAKPRIAIAKNFPFEFANTCGLAYS